MLVNEPQIRFVHERRWLERVSDYLFPHRAHGRPVQLVINERHELVCCGAVATSPLCEKLGDA